MLNINSIAVRTDSNVAYSISLKCRYLVNIILEKEAYAIFSSFQEWANAMARRPSSVRPSVCLPVCLSVNFCANRCFSLTNGRIATKLAHDGHQVSLHPGCSQGQGQGQRSRDTRTFWILGMSYSVIDGLVARWDPSDCKTSICRFK